MEAPPRLKEKNKNVQSVEKEESNKNIETSISQNDKIIEYEDGSFSFVTRWDENTRTEKWVSMESLKLSKYLISTHGRIFFTRTRHFTYGNSDDAGYHYVCLTTDDGKSKNYNVH